LLVRSVLFITDLSTVVVTGCRGWTKAWYARKILFFGERLKKHTVVTYKTEDLEH